MSSREKLVIGLIIIFTLLGSGIFYWAIKSGKIAFQASETEVGHSDPGQITLRPGENGNIVSFPYDKANISGLDGSDKIYLYQDGSWREVGGQTLSAGPAFMIKSNTFKTLSSSGDLAGPVLVGLTRGDNFFGIPYPYPINLSEAIISYQSGSSYISKSLLDAYSEGIAKGLEYYDNSRSRFVPMAIKAKTQLKPFIGYKIVLDKDKAALGYRNE